MLTLCNKCELEESCCYGVESCYVHRLLQKIESLEYRNLMLVETLAEYEDEKKIEVGDMVKSLIFDQFTYKNVTGLVLAKSKSKHGDGSDSLLVKWEYSPVKDSEHIWYINSKDVVKV